MKNLTLLYRRSHKYEEISAKFIVQHAMNENVSFVYDGNIVKSLNHVTSESKDLCSYEKVIAMDFIQLNECLCLATEDGEIIQYNLNDDQCEVVGLIGDGIEAMSWSPDQELVVFVTKSCNVILMFSTYDVLVESALHDKAAKEFITVGWGKKETQFHGSVGKDGRKKEDVTVDNVDELDKTISCCWRGDGEYFAVNHVGANGRMFKVYDKEGNLQYTSEVCANLQVPMTWKPSGLWISKPEIHPNKYSITLFERNGLRHNELVLPFQPEVEEVVNLSWSLDSDIFLIETCRNKSLSCLYFYTICNYHWYLKHYEEHDGKIVYTWSQSFSDPKQLHLITSEGAYQTLKFDFVVDHSSGMSDNDESIVAVVDGFKLLLTTFRTQLMPPPMASLEVSLNVPVNSVAFLQHPSGDFDSNSFLTLDHKNVIKIYRCVFNGSELVETEVVKEFTLKSSTNESFSNATWINPENILVACDNAVFLCCVDSGCIVAELPTENVIGSISSLSREKFILQLIDGTLQEVEIASSELSITDAHLDKLPEFCEKVVATFINQETRVYASKHIKKKLFFNSKELANEVTSFAITSDNDYLIYTTIGELKFLDIRKSSPQVVETRKVERGSKIVSLVKDKAQIIFQLPRGNLESISPRILSLKIIKRHLKSSNYKLAFDVMRKERINLNLLIDVNPQKFLKELTIFIEQIDNIQWLNLFLNELKNEDVTSTMYPYCGVAEETAVFDGAFKMENKIVDICQKMLDIFQELDPMKYILPSITCHVKTQKFESAMEMIWNVKKSESGDKTAIEALKYLLYLIDINVLYNIALGMYDFQLVLFVAQKSQKDPKEYVPFLNELNKMTPAYAKYKIDCYLKRFPKAVQHISELCDDEEKFEECIELVKKQTLYEAALIAFAGKQEKYQKICVLYGDHLRVKGKILDASLMYERGGEYQQALSGARNLLDWQRCMLLSKKLSLSDEELKDQASKLLNTLSDAGRWKEACDLVRRFLPHDYISLLDVLVKGKFYQEAILEVALIGKKELLDELVRPQLKQHLLEAITSVENDRQLYLEQKDRLLLIRWEKTKKMQNPDDDNDDTFSETTSIASSQNSRSSSKTFRSSKTKRKHERKLMNLKEGNKYEDVALIDSIWKLVHKIISTENQETIKELLKHSVEMEIDAIGKGLQNTFKDLLLLLKYTMSEIWIPEIMLAGKYPETEEEMLQYNMDHSMSSKLAYELIQPAQRFKPKMTVIDFEMELYRESSKKL